MEFTCEQIGLNKDELQERVIEGIVERMLTKYVSYSDGEDDFENTCLKQKLDKQIMDRIDSEVERVANEHLQPITEELIRNYQLQETNNWGEAKGEPVSFTEYLAERAHKFMSEPVSHDGRTKAEGGYGWTAKSTRMTNAIEKYLHAHIQNAMKISIGDAQKTLNTAIMETVKASLADVSRKVKTNVSVK